MLGSNNSYHSFTRLCRLVYLWESVALSTLLCFVPNLLCMNSCLRFNHARNQRSHKFACIPTWLCRADVQQRVETALGGTLDGNLSIHDVRLVAPNKRMLCLTFRIPAAVAFAKTSPPSESVATTGKPLFEDKSGNAADSDVLQHSKRQRA